MSSVTAPATRFRALDTYRFLAASGVVFYHFENHFQPFLPQPTHRLEGLQFCVDFFFVLSGFVIMGTYGGRIGDRASFGSFLRKRLARIYPLHLATIACFLLIGAGATLLQIPIRDASFFDVSLLPSHLLMIHAWGFADGPGLNIPSWSISAEWFVYLLFPLLALVIRRAGVIFAITLALIIAITVAQARQIAGLGPSATATIDYGNFRALPSFLVGMAAFTTFERFRSIRIPWVFPHLLAIGIASMMLAGAPTVLVLISFPLLVVMLASAERSQPRSIFTSRAGVALGEASFAVYMIHTFFQVAAVVAARRFGWTDVSQLAAIALVTYGAIVVSSIATFRLFEDPMRRRFGRRQNSSGALGSQLPQPR